MIVSVRHEHISESKELGWRRVSVCVSPSSPVQQWDTIRTRALGTLLTYIINLFKKQCLKVLFFCLIPAPYFACNRLSLELAWPLQTACVALTHVTLVSLRISQSSRNYVSACLRHQERLLVFMMKKGKCIYVMSFLFSLFILFILT